MVPFPEGKRYIFLFYKTSELALLSTKSSVSRAEIKDPERDADHYHLMFRLRISAAITLPPYPFIVAWDSVVVKALPY